jgi:hypothetical protein
VQRLGYLDLIIRAPFGMNREVEMSPLFGKHHDAETGQDGGPGEPEHLPRLIELGAELDEAVDVDG